MPDLASLFTTPGYNISYHLLIPVFVQAMASGIRGDALALGYPDNVCPRTVVERMEKDGKIKPATIAKLRRKAAAHQNSLEALPSIIGAVVAGNQVGLGAKYMNTMVLTYLVFRTLYILLYIRTTTQSKSWYRSIAWWICNLCFLVTFWKAGNRINLNLLKV